MSQVTPPWTEGKDGILLEIAHAAKLGLISDLDGTLSNIVDVPDEARISPRNLDLLLELEPKLSFLAIVSGRGVEDLHKRVPIESAILIGNHGMESWAQGETIIAPEALPYRDALSQLLQALDAIQEQGVRIEDKHVSASLHYRQVADPTGFRQRHLEPLKNLAGSYGLNFSEGRMVFEFKAPVQVNKGSAIKHLVSEHESEAFFFLGDDSTDISALDVCKELRIEGGPSAYGIGVHSEEGNPEVVEAADFYADGVSGIEDFLSWLSSARNASST